MPDGLGPILADPALALAADTVSDLEDVRKAAENRLRQLTTDHGLTPHNPDVQRLAALADDVRALEAKAVKTLQLAMRAHPLGKWQRSRKYVGEKQLGRLLGAIRDPYWNDLHDRPRKLRELYAYCGMHVLDGDTGAQGSSDRQMTTGAGVAPARRRGQHSTWNESARMRIWNLASKQIIGVGAHYRPLYDDARCKYANSFHSSPCPRCGPKGKPAQAGSPLSDGHKHARAVRIVAKAILRDLWEESRRLHKSDRNDTGYRPDRLDGLVAP